MLIHGIPLLRRNARRAFAGLASLLLFAGAAPPYDLVIRGGRVMDPETGLDAVRQVGIRDGRVAAISEAPLDGRTVIDAAGLVVAPGFIDVHSHARSIQDAWLQAFDGVTTALELEGGGWPVDDAYRRMAAGGRPTNYGYSVSWYGARTELLGERAQAVATDEEVRAIVARVEKGLDAGGLGLGTPVGYATATNRTEYLELGRLAARRGVPMFTHVRAKNARDPSSAVEGFGEVIAVAASTGATMHLCHINSSALRDLPRIAAMIAKAQSYGLPVSTEAYPWAAGSTAINAPFLAPENLPLMDTKPSDIVYLRTGERPATAERLAELRRVDPNGRVIIHYLDETLPEDRHLLEQAVTFPEGLIASDAVPYQLENTPIADRAWPLTKAATGHPRSAATFTKVLGQYVRENGRLTLMEAIRRSTLLPARLIEPASQQMRRKGRIQTGSDADIVVFDPTIVAGMATYEDPTAPARGMIHVIVGGMFVIRDGALIPSAMPGRAVRGPIRDAKEKT